MSKKNKLMFAAAVIAVLLLIGSGVCDFFMTEAL